MLMQNNCWCTREMSVGILEENISGTNFTYLQGAKVASILNKDDKFCRVFLGEKGFCTKCSSRGDKYSGTFTELFVSLQ